MLVPLLIAWLLLQTTLTVAALLAVVWLALQLAQVQGRQAEATVQATQLRKDLDKLDETLASHLQLVYGASPEDREDKAAITP